MLGVFKTLIPVESPLTFWLGRSMTLDPDLSCCSNLWESDFRLGTIFLQTVFTLTKRTKVIVKLAVKGNNPFLFRKMFADRFCLIFFSKGEIEFDKHFVREPFFDS